MYERVVYGRDSSRPGMGVWLMPSLIPILADNGLSRNTWTIRRGRFTVPIADLSAR